MNPCFLVAEHWHMIGHFPVPYPDEILYSVIARAAGRLDAHSAKRFVEHLFGCTELRATVNFTGRLGKLASRLPSGHPLTPDVAIDNHTLYPWVAPFLPVTCAEELRRRMIVSDGRSLEFLAGFMQSRIRRASNFYSCPRCDADDIEQWGEPYWHRLFQIPGVFFCPRHEVALNPSLVLRPEGRLIQRFDPACIAVLNTILTPVDMADASDRDRLRIAQHAEWLLQHRPRLPAGTGFRDVYAFQLRRKGLITFSGRVRQQLLHAAFCKRFSRRLLNCLQSPITESGREDWLTKLLRGDAATASPIRHLILLLFLEWSPAELFAAAGPTRLQRTRQSRWPCRNPICPAVGKLLIRRAAWKSTHEHNQEEFTVMCPTCGYTYRGRLNSVRFRVVDRGPRWRGLLRKRWGQIRHSLRSIAREFKADPMTVKRHAAALGLVFPRPSIRPTRCKPIPFGHHLYSQDKELKARWKAARSANPGLSRAQLRRRFQSLFAALYRRDRNWLFSHQPRRRGRSGVHPQADWKSRDAAYLSRVGNVVDSIRRQASPLRRVTVTAICTGLGAGWIERHRHKLPRTWKAILAAAESRAQYAVRRVKRAAKVLATAGHRLSSWRLRCAAGLRPEVALLPAVQAEVIRWVGKDSLENRSHRRSARNNC
jgi:hypothetical protein